MPRQTLSGKVVPYANFKKIGASADVLEAESQAQLVADAEALLTCGGSECSSSG